jgi:SAM-dependent methyltransferase
LASIHRYDTYALNLQAIWSRFNGTWLEPSEGRILLAGCGAFAPYPFRLSNPSASIDALDLSLANLRRARLHCAVHRCKGISWHQGSFLDPGTLPGPYHFIDAFGVLHHLENPLEGFQVLADRLSPGGVLRVMVYGRYARQEAESIRRAARVLSIKDVQGLKRLFRKARPGGRVRDYLNSSWESRTDTGLADLFLHPSVKTYRMDEFLELAEGSGLVPLLFSHTGAVPDPMQEITRFREMDRRRESHTNIICYLGKQDPERTGLKKGSLLRLNPTLEKAVSICRIKGVKPENRLGRQNPEVDRRTRAFLRRFRVPVSVESLGEAELKIAEMFVESMFLLCYRDC